MSESNDKSNLLGTHANSIAARDITLLDVLLVLVKRKGLLLGIPMIAAIIGAAYSLWTPSIYTATTVLLPPQQPISGSAALLGQLGGGLGAIAGGAAGLRNQGDLFVGLLKSRTIGERLVARFALQEAYQTTLPSDAATQLIQSNSRISIGKDGLITIEVMDKVPKRAAEIANGFYEELSRMTQSLAVTEASQRRLFYEKQVALALQNLVTAESAAKQSMENSGVVNVDGQGRALIQMTAQLRAQISAKEIQIGAMRSYAAPNNPELIQAQQALAVLKLELSRMEGTATYFRNPSSATFRKDVEGLKSLQQLREVKYHETMYELLVKQLEMAKIDESKDASLIQVIDVAVEPERRSSPRRTLIVTVGGACGLFLAIIFILMLEALQSGGPDQQRSEKISILRRYLGFKER